MARRNKKAEGSSAAWLVTFSDLMTLLLTFFVLLLSMASMDTTVISRISALNHSASPIPQSGPGRIPEKVSLIVRMLKDPANILNKQKRIKDLLFPVTTLPPDISYSELDKNLTLLAHPEGVVIVLTDSLLFDRDSARLAPRGKKLLEELTPVMLAVAADINISGYAGEEERLSAGAPAGLSPTPRQDAYELSYTRSASVLEYFLQAKVPPVRFSVSGYGPDKPAFSTVTEEGRKKNRRVEILVKTTPRIAGY